MRKGVSLTKDPGARYATEGFLENPKRRCNTYPAHAAFPETATAVRAGDYGDLAALAPG
jgi:hypothetical protein